MRRGPSGPRCYSNTSGSYTDPTVAHFSISCFSRRRLSISPSSTLTLSACPSAVARLCSTKHSITKSCSSLILACSGSLRNPLRSPIRFVLTTRPFHWNELRTGEITSSSPSPASPARFSGPPLGPWQLARAGRSFQQAAKLLSVPGSVSRLATSRACLTRSSLSNASFRQRFYLFSSPSLDKAGRPPPTEAGG